MSFFGGHVKRSVEVRRFRVRSGSMLEEEEDVVDVSESRSDVQRTLLLLSSFNRIFTKALESRNITAIHF